MNSFRCFCHFHAGHYFMFKVAIGEAVICKEKEEVMLSIKGEDEMRFPIVWLRDNCQCSACFHQDSKSRTIDLESFDINSKPRQVKVSTHLTSSFDCADGYD